MRRTGWLLCWLLCWVVAAAAGGSDLAERIAEIERANVTLPWAESARLIEAISPELDAATPEQRVRVELVRLRNLALSGEYPAGIERTEALLKQPMAAELRLRALNLGVNMAANSGDFPHAFNWLKQGLALAPAAGTESANFLGMASYLYSSVGENQTALQFAHRAMLLVKNSDDLRRYCLAWSDLALAQDNAGLLAEAEHSRRQQLQACTEAADPVFVANAQVTLGDLLHKQGRSAEGLRWLRTGLAGFQRAGYVGGQNENRLDLAEMLLASGGDRAEAEALLAAVLGEFEQRMDWSNLQRARRGQSRAAELRGDWAESVRLLKLVDAAGQQQMQVAKARQMAFLQVEFQSQFKDQQITLLEKDQAIARLQTRAAERRQLVLVLGLLAVLVIVALLLSFLRRTRADRRRYRWLSEHDGLTGLYNHQHARALGEAAFQAARHQQRPFVAVTADVDYFKQINDRCGHAVGDQVLRRLGGWLSEVFAAHGVIGRSGGEEFSLFLNCDRAGAEQLIGTLRKRLETVRHAGHSVNVTLSFGLCQARPDEPGIDRLLRESDLAMYKAKQRGRDRVVDASELAAGHDGRGGLVVVGTGIELGRHISERSLTEIRRAERVFCLADAFALAMVMEMRPDTISLSGYYAEGRDRRETYREMTAAIMAEVLSGVQVCAVFYGHPGVFAQVPHAVIAAAREHGVAARMEPAISAEACLYADLGIDPGDSGVQSIEATQFLVCDHLLDCSCLVLLWQVALSGDLSCTRFEADVAGIQALVDKLRRWYPLDHQVILYEAAVLPIQKYRAEQLPLGALPGAQYQEFTTLVIPPLRRPRREAPTVAAGAVDA